MRDGGTSETGIDCLEEEEDLWYALSRSVPQYFVSH